MGEKHSDFRVAPGELRDAVSGLDVLLFEESIETIPEGDQLASARVIVKNG